MRDVDNLPLSYSPGARPERSLFWWVDSVVYDLGEDPTGKRFEAISELVKSGRYYPSDVIIFTGRFRKEHRALQKGDRVVQTARVIPFIPWLTLSSVVEILEATFELDYLKVAYVTTKKHFGKGTWSSQIERKDGRITAHVKCESGPGSFWFWVGLPYARWLQKRAWRKAIERFRNLQSLEDFAKSHGPAMTE